MKLAVIGATGPTGQHVVTEALAKGHSVVAVVRNPGKMATQHENLKVIEADLTDPTSLAEKFRGCDAVLSAMFKSDDIYIVLLARTPVYRNVVEADLTDPTSLAEHFRGCDAVLSAVGTTGGMFKPVDIYTVVGKCAVTAMRESGVKRLIYITAWGTKDDPGLPFFWRWVLRKTFLRHILPNMAEFEDFLSNDCKDITYTIVKPGYLRDWPSSGRPLDVSEGQYVKGYQTLDISRQDVAIFMLSCLETEEYDNKLMAITSSKGT